MQRQGTPFCRLLWIALALCAAVAGESAFGQQTNGCPGPVGESQLAAFIKDKLPEAQVRQLITQCGIAYTFSAELGERLRAAGASDAMVSMLRAEWEKGKGEAARRLHAELAPWEFVAIPPGEFVMGCSPGDSDCVDDERPPHRVRITKGFEIDKYEITQSQWAAVMGSNPSDFKDPQRPVEQVSWNDVQDFLVRLNAGDDTYHYLLPTEAEWEYAARAGTTGKYYGDLNTIAWYGRNSDDQTHPVGEKQPNAWGVYDMLGNVWEWCQDWYGAGYYQQFANSPAVDPRGPSRGQYRVFRGGSWYKYLTFLRVSSRFYDRPSAKYRHLGFRCVREKR